MLVREKIEKQDKNFYCINEGIKFVEQYLKLNDEEHEFLQNTKVYLSSSEQSVYHIMDLNNPKICVSKTVDKEFIEGLIKSEMLYLINDYRIEHLIEISS